MSLTYTQAVEHTITAGEQIHQIVNGTATTEVTVEDGSKVPSIRKALLDNFYFKDPIAWQVGQTENVFNQLRQFTDGSWWYAPSATASNPISMGSTPVGDPLWKIYDFDAIGKLEPRIDEALRRSYAEAGYTLRPVTESFRKGGTLPSATDVLLDETSGKAYSGSGPFPQTVVAGTSTVGFTDRSSESIRQSLIGFVKMGLWNDVKVVNSKFELVSDSSGYFWEWLGTFPHTITTEPTTSGWRCRGLCIGYDLTDSRNWVKSGATPDDTNKYLSLCIATYNTVRLMEVYRGSKALVIGTGQSITGQNRETCGYTNYTGTRETLGSVIAPEMDGLTDDYNVIADLIIKATDNAYAHNFMVDSVSFGIGGRNIANLPEYNIYAPRCSNSRLSRVRMQGATIACIHTKCWFSSLFELVYASAYNAIYGWKIGEDSFTATAPVSMTSNTFNSCGCSSAPIGWLIQNGTYSTFNSCFGEGNLTRGIDDDAAFKLVNPAGLVFNACGAEKLTVKTLVVRSNAIYYNRFHCRFNEFENGFGSTYSGAWFDIDGRVDVMLDDCKMLPQRTVDMLLKTTNGARVTVEGNIPFDGSTTDSTSPVFFPGYVIQGMGKPANGELVPNDNKVFVNGVCKFKMKVLLDAVVSAENKTASAQKLYINKKGFTASGFPQTVPANMFGLSVSKVVHLLSPGEDVTVWCFDFPARFGFTSGDGGMSYSYTSIQIMIT